MTFALILTPALGGDAWSSATRDDIVRTLREIDHQLDAPIPGEHDTLDLVPRKGIGLDWLIEPARIVVAPQVSGIKPERAEQVFATLLQSTRTLHTLYAVQVRAEPLGRTIDIDTDHEALAKSWLEHCNEAAREHVEATRSGSRFSLVAIAVLLALVLAATQAQNTGTPWVALAVSLPLAVLAVLWFRNRRR